MRKVKYYYNIRTLKYEKLVVPVWKRILQFLGFLSAAIVTSFIIVSVAYRFFASPTEMRMRSQLTEMQDKYRNLSGKMNGVDQQLIALQKRDNNIYRAIFEAKPIPDSVRAGQEWQDMEYTELGAMDDGQLMKHASMTLGMLEHRIEVQNKSFNQVDKLVKNKNEMLAHIPAIQPISNKDLTRIASGFGYRIDPIYKTIKMHPGMDFAAPRGTPIYATGDGVVEFAGNDNDGYGNHVLINNGYGYETLFGHMYKIKVHDNQKVKRGQVIGWVGDTGKSTGPHLHYEVIKDGVKVNPAYYFYNDLTPQQFERMLEIASSGNQSLD
ncbi:MAG: M23 family metallopeptidase [Chitinophagaceae bacterium]